MHTAAIIIDFLVRVRKVKIQQQKNEEVQRTVSGTEITKGKGQKETYREMVIEKGGEKKII